MPGPEGAGADGFRQGGAGWLTVGRHLQFAGKLSFCTGALEAYPGVSVSLGAGNLVC